MSHSSNRNVNFGDVCNLSFQTRKVLIRHQSYASKHKLLEKMFGSDDGSINENQAKSMEMMYDSDEDFIYLKISTKTKTEPRTKENTKDIIKTKPITKTKKKTEHSIYSGNKFECKECHAEIRKK